MEKCLNIKSRTYKTIMARSAGNMDVTYIITNLDELVIVTDGSYVTLGYGYAKNRLVSFINKVSSYVAEISKTFLEQSTLVNARLIQKTSKIKKEAYQ